MGKIIKNSAGKVLTASGGAFEVTATIDSNITAGNIKKDVTILGVTGTYDAGGGGIEEKDVNFRDYDGTIVASYTAQEFASLSALPSNPTHTGLTSQGWNWTLANAKTFVAAHGGLEIGQMYVTDDGKTRLYLDLPYAGEVKLICPTSGDDTGDGVNDVDWGDGTTSTPGTNITHTYATAGKKLITITCKTSRLLKLGTSNNGSLMANGLARISIYKAEIGSRVAEMNQTFSQCFNLQSVTMPLGITSKSLGGVVFSQTALKFLTIPSDITSIGENFLYEDTVISVIENISLPNGIQRIGGTFVNVSGIKKMYLPDTITAFLNSTDTIATNKGQFLGCRYLKTINFPSSFSSFIPRENFKNCFSLDDVTLPSGLTAIGESAFYNCRSLREVTIPANVNDIRSQAFGNCFVLTDVYLLPIVPPTLANKNAFPSPITLHVPHGYLETYQTASVWSGLASRMVEMPE